MMLETQAIQLIKMREKWVGLGYSRTERKQVIYVNFIQT